MKELLMGMAIIAIIAATAWYFWYGRESFTSKDEKVDSIYNWFMSHRRPNYADYRKDLKGQSNIVEYEDVLRLAHNRNLTRKSVEDVV